MSYAVRLAEALKTKGMTSNALSKKLEISSTAVWNWIHGNTKPKPEMLLRVAYELGVSPEWLRDGEEGPQQETHAKAEAPQSTVQEVLSETKARLALIMKVPENRIRLELSLSLEAT